jgi:hypothetical protein
MTRQSSTGFFYKLSIKDSDFSAWKEGASKVSKPMRVFKKWLKGKLPATGTRHV